MIKLGDIHRTIDKVFDGDLMDIKRTAKNVDARMAFVALSMEFMDEIKYKDLYEYLSIKNSSTIRLYRMRYKEFRRAYGNKSNHFSDNYNVCRSVLSQVRQERITRLENELAAKDEQ